MSNDNAEEARVARLRETYVELSTLDDKLKQLQEQLEYFDEQFGQIATISTDLEQLKQCKEGDRVLVPVHQGIFLRARLESSDDLVVNVGNGVAVDKKLDEAIGMITGQLTDMQHMREQITQQMQQLMNRAEQLQSQALRGE